MYFHVGIMSRNHSWNISRYLFCDICSRSPTESSVSSVIRQDGYSLQCFYTWRSIWNSSSSFFLHSSWSHYLFFQECLLGFLIKFEIPPVHISCALPVKPPKIPKEFIEKYQEALLKEFQDYPQNKCLVQGSQNEFLEQSGEEFLVNSKKKWNPESENHRGNSWKILEGIAQKRFGKPQKNLFEEFQNKYLKEYQKQNLQGTAGGILKGSTEESQMEIFSGIPSGIFTEVSPAISSEDLFEIPQIFHFFLQIINLWGILEWPSSTRNILSNSSRSAWQANLRKNCWGTVWSSVEIPD